MPSIFSTGGYVVFFWSNEGNEPIHVHIAKGQPTANSTKIRLSAPLELEECAEPFALSEIRKLVDTSRPIYAVLRWFIIKFNILSRSPIF